ncbi:hypothetical protein Rmf_42600 [Roseomonas fluvialis]|uniref:Uncharacterized protein n=2 Tax=Roseomonas fluvialis TaxID=1750527 RepID=A0ABM7Y8G1_9PROT|nr:hypothetical protein Rmf_42600 [Roseomonas fluvialis]
MDELRRVVRKLGAGTAEASDHALYGIAVDLTAQQGVCAKLVNTALDDRNRMAIRSLGAATDAKGLRAAWRYALAEGGIPGAYWAVLTHPGADQALISEVFGDMHMPSHPVGAAKRADVRQLAAQDREITALRETVARQQ